MQTFFPCWEGWLWLPLQLETMSQCLKTNQPPYRPPSCAELMVVGGQTCITAAAAAQPSPQDLYQTVHTEIRNDSSETPTSSQLSIYRVSCKSKGKPRQCSLGVVMQSPRGQRRRCRAARIRQWSPGVPCHVSMLYLVPGGYSTKKRELSQTSFLSGVAIRF